MVLHQAVDDYLALRRALGFLLPSYDGVLHDFASFLEREASDHITIELVARWAGEPTDITSKWRAGRAGIVRGFARYWSARDPRTQVPPVDLIPHQRRHRTPYLYTEDEIARLMDAAQHMKSPDPLWPTTLSTLFGLLAVTGLRVGEALALKPDDVDLERGIIAVRSSKFRKSRLVPLHPSTRQELRTYLRQREHHRPDSPRFFVSASGRELRHGPVYRAFQRLLAVVGIVRGRPRMHDLRHRFAIQTLVRWYRAGNDVERRLPTLSAYLGHRHPSDTYWYLSAAPELMGKARARFERHWGAPP
jgi:integrase/recombinase XerD